MKSKMNGTGTILPRIAVSSTGSSDSPAATPYGTAPRSSITGTIDMPNTIRYLVKMDIGGIVISFQSIFSVRLCIRNRYTASSGLSGVVVCSAAESSQSDRMEPFFT